ncbi:hypothetical protein P4V47_01220 [Brevibacillus laterosporus]|uniref:hypothetical protein n=1 Tax=Brevibacillus laterosporus TaxID=1465 RepID=UPI002E226C6A|nr:hypothetical protein [Brevibacillus laterosporus]
MAKVTALFEARDRISPELIRMRRETDRTSHSFGGMRRGFKREAQRMEREIHSLRADLKRLQSVKARPKVELDDKASQGIANVRQQLMGLAGLAAGITIGAGAGGIMTDLQAAFRERALYAAKGKTQEEIKAFDKRSKELVNMNPYLNLQESMAIQSRSEQLNGKKGGVYAEEAAKLGVTTKYTSDEHLKMLSVMSKSMEVDDPKRLANAIQYMSNNLVDFKDEFVDSVVEYTVQTSKFLDTPEKLATLVGEIGQLGVWSDDKALDALKEASLKFTNQGDLTNVLKTGFETGGMKSEDAQKKAESEAEIVNELLHSDNEADNKSAMGRLMMAVATIEDKNMRQQVLNELGAGPGEDLAKHFAPLLQVAGKISTGELKSKVASNEADKAYKLAVDSNPLFEYQQAQNNAKQAVMDFGAKLAKDATPALTSLSKAAGWVAEKFNRLSDTTRIGLELAGAGGVLLGSGYMLIRSAKMQMMAAQALKRAAGGSGDFDFDSDGRKDKKEKRKGKGKKRSWNPFKRDKSVPRGLSPEDAKRLAFYGSEPAKQGMWDKAKNFGGKAVGGIKSVGGSIAKKLPYIGTAAGVGLILASDDSDQDKVTSLARMGAEIGGGALGGAVGGAVTGAIVGSVVPGIGTAVGAAIGGAGALIGSAIGAWGGGELFDKAKDWWFGKEEPPDTGPSRSKEEMIGSIVDPLKGMAMKTAMGQTVSQLADKFSPGIKTWWKGQVKDYAIKNGMPVPEDKSFSDVIKPLETSVKKMVMNTGMGQVGSQLFDKYSPDIKKWWDGQVKDYAQKLSVPTQSPAAKKEEEKPKLTALTVSSLPITLNAAGVLQDVSGLIKLLRDPSVTNEVKRIIETAFVNAYETGGGKA